MAIQLNDRDHLIFNLIDEHQVLLEKHISWFISGEDKPVLIRDRLRKLFYLDYLLCHRHGTKLPWWTTPTKPLVYMLSSMTRSLSAMKEPEIDLFDANVQRHLLEIANIRMLYLMGVKDGGVTDFHWTTMKGNGKRIDAKAEFRANESAQRVGIVNHPTACDDMISRFETALKEDGIDKILIISRDEAHQMQLQMKMSNNAALQKRCLFATHQELYKSGVVGADWQHCDKTSSCAFRIPTIPVTTGWNNNLIAATA